MNRIIKSIWRGCVLAMPLASLACGIGGSPDATSSSATGLVKGKVIVSGKPLTKTKTKTELRFNPSNINRMDAPSAVAPVTADGTYEVTTLVGQNQVSLSGPGVAKSPKLSYFTTVIDVKPGDNEFDIEIP
jgi:hypothetical protein